MTLWRLDAASAYRDTIAQATTSQRTLTVADLDVIERGFRRAWASGEHEAAIWQYHDGRGYMPPTRLWRAVQAILESPDRHSAELVERARSLHTLLASAADCDVHERAVANDARIAARWREPMQERLTPPSCAWTRAAKRRAPR